MGFVKERLYKLKSIVEEQTNAEENILKHFAESFLELRSTIHFLDGFFATRPFLKDYKKSIDQSVIMLKTDIQKNFPVSSEVNYLNRNIPLLLKKLKK